MFPEGGLTVGNIVIETLFPSQFSRRRATCPAIFFSKIGKPRKIVAVAFFPSHFNEGGKLDQSRKRVQEVPLQGEAAGVENIELSQQILSVRIFLKKQILIQRPWVTYQPFSNRFFLRQNQFKFQHATTFHIQ
jgi:hypothetical protein